MSIKLRTNDTWKAGQTNIIPGAGTVVISDNCEIEVESMEIADQVIKADIGFYLSDGFVETIPDPIVEQINIKSEQDNLGGTSEDKNDIGGDKKEEDEIDPSELINALKEKELPELKELAKPFPKKEWKDLTQEGLVAYLADKLK